MDWSRSEPTKQRGSYLKLYTYIRNQFLLIRLISIVKQTKIRNLFEMIERII